MKSPAELQVVLRRQWRNRALREARLLGAEGAWPWSLSIGPPSPRRMRTDLDAVKRHIEAWRRVRVGEVLWRPVRYRSTADPVDAPIAWRLRRPSEWIDACGETAIDHEFAALTRLAEQTDPQFHSLFIRRRSLWRDKPLDEVVQAAQLALALQPGIAGGKPLRLFSLGGVDTKFYERHERLLTSLLDLRFDGEASERGLEAFLGAYAQEDHWLLVIDLDGSLLPFGKQRVRSSELASKPLPGRRLLLVENESCQHLLPSIPGAIAILGAGFDLNWTSRLRQAEKRIGYWGDLDTWGLQFLAQAREQIEPLDALMMSAEIFEQFSAFAVPEPVTAGPEPPAGLRPPEQSLYRKLQSSPRGRLEQEFLPADFVRAQLKRWAEEDTS